MLLQEGEHYMIYTPSDPLLFVAVKVSYHTQVLEQLLPLLNSGSTLSSVTFSLYVMHSMVGW